MPTWQPPLPSFHHEVMPVPKWFLNRQGRYQPVGPHAQSPRRWFPGMTCSICGAWIRQWQEFNFDHEIPIARGGRRGRANKHHTHVLCNSVKGDRYPFSLRTEAEREAVRDLVHPDTYQRLLKVWAGESG